MDIGWSMYLKTILVVFAVVYIVLFLMTFVIYYGLLKKPAAEILKME